MGYRKPGLTWADVIPGSEIKILADYLSVAVLGLGQPIPSLDANNTRDLLTPTQETPETPL